MIHGVWDMTFSPDSQSLVTSSTDGVIYQWNVATFTPVELFRGRGMAWSLSYADDSNRLVFAYLPDTIAIWDTASRQEITTISVSEIDATPFVVSFMDGGQTIIAGFDDGSLKMLDIARGNHIKSLAGNDDRITSLLVLPDKKHVWIGYWSGNVGVWDTQNNSEPITFPLFLQRR
jgi:WD40 repeat protein